VPWWVSIVKQRLEANPNANAKPDELLAVQVREGF